MEQHKRISVILDFDKKHSQNYFFGNKERKEKFNKIWQSEKIQQELENAKKAILSAEGELSQYRSMRDKEFFEEWITLVKDGYIAVVISTAVTIFIDEEGKKALDEILLDIISSRTVQTAIKTATEETKSAYEKLTIIDYVKSLMED